MSTIGRRIDFKVRYPQLEQGPAEFHTGKRYFGFNKNFCIKERFGTPDRYRESFIDVVSPNSKNFLNKGGLGVTRSAEDIDSAFNPKLNSKLTIQLEPTEPQSKTQSLDVPYNKISRKNYAKDKLYVSIHNEFITNEGLNSSVSKLPYLQQSKQTPKPQNSSLNMSGLGSRQNSTSPENSSLYSRNFINSRISRTRTGKPNSSGLFKANPTAYLARYPKDKRNESEFSRFLMKSNETKLF